MQKIYIKNMVCNRCILVVEQILKKTGVVVTGISLGEVELEIFPEPEQLRSLISELEAVGFEVIDDRRSRIAEKIKNCILDLIHRQDGKLKYNLSDYLADRIHQDYAQLSALFSETEGITIEKYFIAQKIERVKELLAYDDLSLTEIADRLNYSSVAHLSSQFKKTTGFTTSYYRRMADKRRKPLDHI